MYIRERSTMRGFGMDEIACLLKGLQDETSDYVNQGCNTV
jgi:hypothetical protein